MSTPAKKHAAEQEQVSTSSKRPATGTAEYVTLEDEENCTYHLTVKLHSKYDVFPAQLRATVQKAYKETIRQQMDLLTYGPDSQERPERTYTLSIERRVKSSSSANTSSSPQNLDEQPGTTVVRSALTTLSLANTMLLGLFLDKFKPVAGQVIFVELRTKEGLANPDFGNLHAVRHGEVGWGLDCWGCASLYTVSIVDGRLREMVLFVERSAGADQEGRWKASRFEDLWVCWGIWASAWVRGFGFCSQLRRAVCMHVCGR